MLPLIVLAAVAVPVFELYVLVRVADLVGWPLALIAFCALPFVGVRVVRHYGIAAVRSVQEALRQRRLPGKSLLEHGLSTVAGILIVIPGFVSAALGGLLLIPPVRRLVSIGIFAYFTRHFHAATRIAAGAVVVGRRRGGGDDVIDVTVVTNQPAPAGTAPPPDDVWIDTGWDGSATGIAALPGDVAPAGSTVDSGTRARIEESFFDEPGATSPPVVPDEVIDVTPADPTSVPAPAAGAEVDAAPGAPAKDDAGDDAVWEMFAPDPDAETTGIPEKRRGRRKRR